MSSNEMSPLIVEVHRGTAVESIHLVDLAVIDADGQARLAFGDIDRAVYPRSALKPFQAMQLVNGGAIERFGLDLEHVALACASHAGEEMHVRRVQAWLERLGLDETALACGPHPPGNSSAAIALYASGKRPTKIHNNCSGKHTGLICACRASGLAIEGYDQLGHPMQHAIARDVRRWFDVDHLPPPGIDGCGLPNWPIPLRNLALGLARFTAAVETNEPTPTTIADAMTRHPGLVAGTGRLCTTVMQANPRVLAKTGAEGVYVAALLDGGLGVALKVRDGAARASRFTLANLLHGLGLFQQAEQQAALASELSPVIKNFAGVSVGHIQFSEESRNALNAHLNC